MVTSNHYIYICTTCNEIVDEKDKACPNCGGDLGKEISEKELENIINKGPDKAHTFLIECYENREKSNAMALGAMLIKRFPDTRQGKWASEIIEKAKEIIPKKEKYNKETQKYCPNCKKVTAINQQICHCGYNFDSPNLNEIEVVRLKRKRKNKVSGTILFIIGVVFLIKEYFALSVKEPSQIGRTLPDQLAIVLPILAIIIGIYQLFTGKAPKKPTKTFLDNIFGSKHGEDPNDNISYIFCSSCGKQLLKEMNYKYCPNCRKRIS